MRARPFRAPHHTISDVALVGGGSMPRPGEISLAHHGVLFLDEMPEFTGACSRCSASRSKKARRDRARGADGGFPARFMLVGGDEPVPVRFLGDPRRACRCTPLQVRATRPALRSAARSHRPLVVEAARARSRRRARRSAASTSVRASRASASTRATAAHDARSPPATRGAADRACEPDGARWTSALAGLARAADRASCAPRTIASRWRSELGRADRVGLQFGGALASVGRGWQGANGREWAMRRIPTCRGRPGRWHSGAIATVRAECYRIPASIAVRGHLHGLVVFG